MRNEWKRLCVYWQRTCIGDLRASETCELMSKEYGRACEQVRVCVRVSIEDSSMKTVVRGRHASILDVCAWEHGKRSCMRTYVRSCVCLRAYVLECWRVCARACEYGLRFARAHK